jgi:hypothetical protein
MCHIHGMTTTLKATHKGTCQVCGRAQAHFKGTIAKHGYTVDWGFFNGVCAGAEHQPLEQDKALTERIMAELLNDVAPRAEKLAADLRSGAVQPKWFNRVPTGTRKFGVPQYNDVECTRAEISDQVAAQQVENAAYKAEGKARNARSHAAMLEKLIAARHGQPLMPIVLHKELAVGMSVRIGGKKGKIYEVVELKRIMARGCGPYMNGKLLPHAIFKRSNGEGTFAVPTQTIRQAAIVEGGAQ